MATTIHTTKTPTIGSGCTIRWYSDRKAATVIAVSPTGYKVTVREDRSIRLDKNGMSDSQHYDYEPDPEGREHVFYRRGDVYATDGKSLQLGTRSTYHDYGF